MLAEHASTSHVTYMLHHVNPKGQYPEKKEVNEKRVMFKGFCVGWIHEKFIEITKN